MEMLNLVKDSDGMFTFNFLITMKYVYYLQSYNIFIISSPTHMGLLDPETSDGRIIFFLPWEQYTVAGLLCLLL